MRKVLLTLFAFCLLTLVDAENSKTITELNRQLRKADTVWIKGTPDNALPLYQNILKSITPETEFIAPFIVMRIARAEFANGNKKASLDALKKLDSIYYVNEDILLAAKELKAMIDGKQNPGVLKTQIPPIEKAEKNWYVPATAKREGDGSEDAPFAKIADVYSSQMIRVRLICGEILSTAEM